MNTRQKAMIRSKFGWENPKESAKKCVYTSYQEETLIFESIVENEPLSDDLEKVDKHPFLISLYSRTIQVAIGAQFSTPINLIKLNLITYLADWLIKKVLEAVDSMCLSKRLTQFPREMSPQKKEFILTTIRENDELYKIRKNIIDTSSVHRIEKLFRDILDIEKGNYPNYDVNVPDKLLVSFISKITDQDYMKKYNFNDLIETYISKPFGLDFTPIENINHDKNIDIIKIVSLLTPSITKYVIGDVKGSDPLYVIKIHRHHFHRMVEIIESINVKDGLENGWETETEFKNDIKKITKVSVDMYRIIYNIVEKDLEELIQEIGDLIKKQHQSQQMFDQLMSEYDTSTTPIKIEKNKVDPVPNRGIDDNPKFEQANITDLLPTTQMDRIKRYRISKRVRRWATNEVDKIRQFTDGNKKRYSRMTSDDIIKRRMFHHLPGADLFIDNSAYAFKTTTGKGLVTTIYYEEEVFDGVLYFGIDKKNIIYHRYFEFFKDNVREILSQQHLPISKLDSNEADWEVEGLYQIEIQEKGVVEIKFPGEQYTIKIHPIMPELL